MAPLRVEVRFSRTMPPRLLLRTVILRGVRLLVIILTCGSGWLSGILPLEEIASGLARFVFNIWDIPKGPRSINSHIEIDRVQNIANRWAGRIQIGNC